MRPSAAISTLYKPAGGKSYTANEQTIELLCKSLPAPVVKTAGAGNFWEYLPASCRWHLSGSGQVGFGSALVSLPAKGTSLDPKQT